MDTYMKLMTGLVKPSSVHRFADVFPDPHQSDLWLELASEVYQVENNVFEWKTGRGHLDVYGGVEYMSKAFQVNGHSLYFYATTQTNKAPIALKQALPWKFYLISKVCASNCLFHYSVTFKDESGQSFLNTKGSVKRSPFKLQLAFISSRCLNFNSRSITLRISFEQNSDGWQEPEFAHTGHRSVDEPLHGSTSFLEHATQTEILHPWLMKDVSTNTDAEKSSLLETLSENLISFYDNKTNTDCVIKIGKSEFPVHRAVMSARSAVFAAMFNHDTTEKLSGEVDIPDIEPTTLSDILFYVYSGKIRGLTQDTAVSMYTFADKYALFELRDVCLEVLLNCLTTENVCDAAVLAHTHGETTLENKVIHFIADRLEEFMESDKWIQFAHEKCLLANKLLCSALIATKKKNIEGKC